MMVEPRSAFLICLQPDACIGRLSLRWIFPSHGRPLTRIGQVKVTGPLPSSPERPCHPPREMHPPIAPLARRFP